MPLSISPTRRPDRLRSTRAIPLTLDDAREAIPYDCPWCDYWLSCCPMLSRLIRHDHFAEQILLEYTWMIPKVGLNEVIKGHLAWANGDTTGDVHCPQIVLLHAEVKAAFRLRLCYACRFRQWASSYATSWYCYSNTLTSRPPCSCAAGILRFSRKHSMIHDA